MARVKGKPRDLEHLAFSCLAFRLLTALSSKPDYDERLLVVEETLQALVRQQNDGSNVVTQNQYLASSTLGENAQPPAAGNDSIGHVDVATFEDTSPPHGVVGEDQVDGLATITDTEQSSSSFYGMLD